MKIEWKSKILDLLIVIIGISIAFQLNNWNESKKSDEEAKRYLASFIEENQGNENNLIQALDFLSENKKNIDTLMNLLLTKKYRDGRMNIFISSMMTLQDFRPSMITMDNIKASGEFDLIRDIDLRKQIISTYDSYASTSTFDQMIMDYANDYVTPYFFENVRFSDLSSINKNILEDPAFENIVIGYMTLMTQQINGYKESLKQVKTLNEYLIHSQK